MQCKNIVLFTGLLLITTELLQSAEAVETRYRLDRENIVKRSNGTRIDRSQFEKCNGCASRDEQMKSKYLERTLDRSLSKDYQKVIESRIFADQSFKAKCWDKVASKDIDFFFTVSKSGKAEDFAWFPKRSVAKCLQRHIKNIEFPIPNRPHHAWLLVTEFVDIDGVKLVSVSK